MSQVTSSKRAFSAGFPPPTRRRIRTLFRRHDVVEPPPGSSRAAHWQNGRRLDPFYGFMVNVCFPNHHQVLCSNNNSFNPKAGAGKSTLLYVIASLALFEVIMVPTRSAIIQDIEDMRTIGLATLAYYYFDFRDVKKQDRYGLISSLVLHLSAESDSCCNILSQLYSDHSRGLRKPTISALKKSLKDMLSLPGQGPIYIVIDGVDECPNLSGTPSAREGVLDVVEDLVNLKLPNVHLCVASRPEVDIRMVLDPLTSLKISLHDESGQKEDIIEYIKSVVHSDRSMRKWKEEDKQLVIDTLSSRADGM